MSVNSKMTAIADEIRAKTGETDTLTLDQMSESISEVYTAGKQAMIDELKLLPTTVSGSYISLDDVSELPHEVECKVESINRLQNKSETTTLNGLTFTVNDDKSITVTGTATEETVHIIGRQWLWTKGIYPGGLTISGTPSGYDGQLCIQVNWDDGDSETELAKDTGDGVSFEIPEPIVISTSIVIESGTTLTDATFYPMLNYGTSALLYTPYAAPGSVKVTRTSKNLCGGEAFAEKIANSIPESKVDIINKTVKLRDAVASAFIWWDKFEPNTRYTVFLKGKNSSTTYYKSTNLVCRFTDGTNEKLELFDGNNSQACWTSPEGKTISQIKGGYYAGTATFEYDYVGLFKGALTLEDFEPYNGQTLTPDANGIVEGMTSTAPYMNIHADTEGVNIEVKYYKSPSTQTYYDEFWDAFQQNGNRTLYQYAFYGSTVGVWNNDNFKPKYPIKPINATQMLTGSGIKGDLTEIVDIDFSMAQCVSSALYLNRYITRVGTIDIRNVSESGLGVVNECTALETVDKVILKDDGTQYPIGGVFNFTNCTSLKNIVFEGKITFNINFKSSPLTKESITSVVNALYEDSTDLTATFKKTAKEAAFTDDEWTELTATKPNWTFTLV